MTKWKTAHHFVYLFDTYFACLITLMFTSRFKLIESSVNGEACLVTGRSFIPNVSSCKIESFVSDEVTQTHLIASSQSSASLTNTDSKLFHSVATHLSKNKWLELDKNADHQDVDLVYLKKYNALHFLEFAASRIAQHGNVVRIKIC